jgi:hypothetical protein
MARSRTYLAPAPRLVEAENLDQLFEGVTVDPVSLKEAVGIAQQLKVKVATLTATDVSQLRSLASSLTRIRAIERLAADAEQAGDSDAYLKMASALDKLTAGVRGLLRDLQVSRAATGTGSVEGRHVGKMGTNWEGVL